MITIEQIRAARGLLDWTQTDLARKSGLSQTAIARIENGTNKPNRVTLSKVHDAFYLAGVEFIERGVRKRDTELLSLLEETQKFGAFGVGSDLPERIQSAIAKARRAS